MLQLVFGNKLYSTWSLRPWILMKVLDIPFEEIQIPLYRPETKAKIKEYSAAGKVPLLIDGDVTVWESLAIVEYLADRFPDKGVWPADRVARARARSLAAEMHAGFVPMRTHLPMNLGMRYARRDRGADTAADVARFSEIVNETRADFGEGGPFLFGAFTAADALFAPVACRIDYHDVGVDAVTRAYIDAILALDAFVEWREAALNESWVIATEELDEEPVEILSRRRDENA